MDVQTGHDTRIARMDAHLAQLLSAGTWLSCALIAAGLVCAVVADALHRDASAAVVGLLLMRSGLATVIALPVMRVAAMALMFARNRDLRFFAIALGVLAIIAAGLAIGIGWHSHVAG
jgi:uncharacterized membrane protein